MLKKAAVVAAAAAGIMLAGSPAFACGMDACAAAPVVPTTAAAPPAIAPVVMPTTEPGNEGTEPEHHFHWHPMGLLDAGNGNNINLVGGACGNNVGVLGGAVPINSPSITGNCAAGGIIGGGADNG
ncbi:hypothetical protein F0L68_10425 [Solihabitans fulvus]|uniref:Small secreted domain n=1 Tax=Solihabitans fulvus TaxID=1892852 RepID=A0A5B2XHJ0_9PSEU|nr:hypothetical protein F0L68_10425 [Solihabitans fulvus]